MDQLILRISGLDDTGGGRGAVRTSEDLPLVQAELQEWQRRVNLTSTACDRVEDREAELTNESLSSWHRRFEHLALRRKVMHVIIWIQDRSSTRVP